jgi:hypothetical protein
MKFLNRVRSSDSERKETDEFADNNSLPLCYASFELIEENYKLTKEDKKFEGSLIWKQPSLFLNDLISDYLDGLCSPSGPPLVVCEPKSRGDGVLIEKSFIFYIDQGEDNEILDRDSLPLCFHSSEMIR